VPTLINPAGTPPCGMFTRLQQQGPTKFTYLSFGVAVTPTGTAREVRMVYQIEGDPSQHAATFEAGDIRSGRHTTVGGAPTKYLMADIGILSVDGVAAAKVAAFLRGSRTITVTVDPQNRISESDERNNVLTLRVTPSPNKSTLAITDNRCAQI
jgi:hypothetical protein